MCIGGKKAQWTEVLHRHAVADGGDGVEQLEFTGARTARRRTREQREATRVGEISGFGEQPGITRELLIDELQMQRAAEGGESLCRGTRTSTITRGEAAADLTLYKGRDNEQRSRPLGTVLGEELVGEARHPFTGGKVGAAQEARQRAVPRLVRGEQHQARPQFGVGHPAPLGVRHEFVQPSSLPLGEGAIGAPIDRRGLGTSTSARTASANTRQRQHHAIAIGDRRVGHLKLHAEQRRQPSCFGGAHEAHRARERALIDQRESVSAEGNRLLHQPLGRGGRAQKAKGRARMQFGKRHQRSRTRRISQRCAQGTSLP